MPEPTITTATAVATTGATLSVLTGVATALGVPVIVAVAAVVGAAAAVAQAGKFELTLKDLISALVTFCLALAFGFFGGKLGTLLLVGVLKPFIALPEGVADAPVTFLLAMLGQRVLLPLVVKRLSSEIEKGGPQ